LTQHQLFEHSVKANQGKSCPIYSFELLIITSIGALLFTLGMQFL